MRWKKLLSVLLAASLLAGLCSCSSRPGSDSSSDSSGSADISASGSASGSGDESLPDISIPPEFLVALQAQEMAQDYADYDPDYTLNILFPDLVDGLELPVAGATGYCSVRLPVYSARPSSKASGVSSSTDTAGTAVVLSAAAEASGTVQAETITASAALAAADDGEGLGGSGEEKVPATPSDEEPQQPEQNPPVTSGQQSGTGTGAGTGSGAGSGTQTEPPAQTETPAQTKPSTQTKPPAASKPAEPSKPVMPDELDTVTSDDGEEEEEEEKPKKSSASSGGIQTWWEPGTAFTILSEEGAWWQVRRNTSSGQVTGWIEHRYCMINLPDVIPSIVYDDTNSYDSRFRSLGKEIPGVTGQAFYESACFNERLNRTEYVMPMLYACARDVCAAQRKALEHGSTLVIYQTFRPYATQRAVVEGLTTLSSQDASVKAAIATPPWSMTHFISTGISNHQRGFAVDVSLAKVTKASMDDFSGYQALRMDETLEYRMPTPMHELSMLSVSVKNPSKADLADSMNEPAIALREYFTTSNFTPLASEWWHFNNTTGKNATAANRSDGKYYMSDCFSELPPAAD